MSIDTILAIVFGLATIFLSVVAIRLQIKTYKKDVEAINKYQGFFAVYTSRDSLKAGIKALYTDAVNHDIIWGQCIGCSNYFENLHEMIFKKSIEGVSFQVIINANSPNKEQMIQLFSLIQTAKTKTSNNVKIRLHGLSNKQVIISFSSLTGMVALHFYSQTIVEIIKSYFDQNWVNDI